MGSPRMVSLLIDHSTTPYRDEPWTVLWTRGQGCAQVAEFVADGQAIRADGDLKTACINLRANVLVTAKAISFDLAATIVPDSLDESRTVPAVIGAVGTGPHSPLVAQTTARLAAGYGADPVLVTMARSADDDEAALKVLRDLALHAPGAETRLVRADTAAELLESLSPEGLIVLGAPGGSWWQRQFFGPGRRLMHAAPAGSVVVRAADRRCFHSLTDLTAVGAPMRARDALAVLTVGVAPVVADGKMIGLVRRAVLAAAPENATVADMMEGPVFAAADDPIASIADLTAHLDGGPVPVLDDEGRLLGGIIV